MIKKIIKKIFSVVGLELKKVSKSGPNPMHLWDSDLYFNDLYESIKDRTLVDKTRCFMLYQFFKQSLILEGEVAEVGVYKGGTAKLLARLSQDENAYKTIHLFDTFSGMPETSEEKDIHKKGDFSDTSLDSVLEYLSSYGNISFYKGLFPTTSAPINDKEFSFVHIDVDIYKSVIDCCEFFNPRMVKGGIMIFDDYGFVSCPGAKLAVDEFFKDKKEFPCYLPSGQCLVVKL